MDLIEELKQTMKEHGFSCDTMARFIGCSGKTVDRWLAGESTPTKVYQGLIRKGLRRVKKL